jgi:CBS domain-containing protein
VGALVVSATGDTVDGIISERDIVRRLARDGEATLLSKVGDIMTADVRTCALDATSDAVMETMTTHRGRHLPVVEGGRLVGIVSIGDVVKAQIDELTLQKQSMQEYISGSSPA